MEPIPTSKERKRVLTMDLAVELAWQIAAKESQTELGREFG
jgi:hypothetical protein